MPATGEAWRHYRGGLYTIIGMASDADGRAMVSYTEYGWSVIQLPPIYVRDIGDFVRQVETGKSQSGKSVMEPRFRFERERGGDEKCPFINPVTGRGYAFIGDFAAE